VVLTKENSGGSICEEKVANYTSREKSDASMRFLANIAKKTNGPLCNGLICEGGKSDVVDGKHTFVAYVVSLLCLFVNTEKRNQYAKYA
jgi:hypothetical protein